MVFRAALPAVLAAAAVFATVPAAAAPLVCPRHADAAPALARLRAALAHGRFVTYQPTSLKVVDGRVTPANPADVRADLGALRERFDGLITYDAVHGAQAIPAIADALKFRALIIGVWNPFDEAEVAAAIDAAHAFPRLVVGVSLGNEMLLSHHTDAASLAALLTRVRAQLPHTPLSTTEPFHLYYEPATADLRSRLDFLLANVHPVFQPWFREAANSNAAQFVVNVVEKLATQSCGPIIVKETGVPTGPASAGFSEGRQAGFYRELRRVFPAGAERAFAYFAAFDAPWRAYDATPVPGAHPQEAHWGLYDADRNPKRAATELSPLPGG